MNDYQKGFVLIILIVVLIFAVLFATVKEVPEQKKELMRQENTLNNIRYIKDHNTGICFAYIASGYASLLTAVDCKKAGLE